MPKKWSDYSPTAKKIYIWFMAVIITATAIIWAIVLLDIKIYTDDMSLEKHHLFLEMTEDELQCFAFEQH